jgi:hypothetical protein
VRGVEGQRLSYLPDSPFLLQAIAIIRSIKSELREGGVEGQRLSYLPPCLLPQLIAFKVEPRDGVRVESRASACSIPRPPP